MPKEIERKFLLANDSWRAKVSNSNSIKQGYLNAHKKRTVRIRITRQKGFLTIKGQTINLTRPEFEYEVPYQDAVDLLALCEQPIIEKTRHLITANNYTWEIDEFEGVNAGLIVAEVEIQSEQDQVQLPEWIGTEVSHDSKYFNSNLIAKPFKDW